MRIVEWFPPLFHDRADGGRALAEAVLAAELELDEPLVVGLAKGGVAVALEVARALDAELAAVSVQRVNSGQRRLGAVTADGPPALFAPAVSEQVLEMLLARARQAAEVSETRLGTSRPTVRGRTVVLVDDGVVTGLTLAAGCRWARAHGVSRLIAATPVGNEQGLAQLAAECDQILCPAPLARLAVVGQAYDVFDSLDEWYVAGLLQEALSPGAEAAQSIEE